MEVSDGAARAHVDQLRSALGARLISICKRPAERTAAAGLGKPIESVVAGRVGGTPGLGRSDHTRGQGRSAVHRAGSAPASSLFAPVVWLTVGLVLWWYGRISGRPGVAAQSLADDARRSRIDRVEESTRRPAGLARSGLSASGWQELSGPDSFGPAHGEFLPQRLVLLGLIALVPVFDADLSRWTGRCSARGALRSRSACNRQSSGTTRSTPTPTAGQIIRAGTLVGRRPENRHSTRDFPKAGSAPIRCCTPKTGWGSTPDNVVWNNYEALHYYFPVQFRPEIERPHPGDLELVSIHEDPKDKATRLRDWETILTSHARFDRRDLVLEERPGTGGDHETVVRIDRTDGRRADLSKDPRAVVTADVGGRSGLDHPLVSSPPGPPRSAFRRNVTSASSR